MDDRSYDDQGQTRSASFDDTQGGDESYLLPSPAHSARTHDLDRSSFDLDDPDAASAQPSSQPEVTLSAASSPARSTSDVDSLANVPWHDVEQIALDLVSTVPVSRERELAHLGGGLDAFDLPRAPCATSKDHLDELERKALEFLKAKVDDTDKDDWMFATPAVFGPPKPLAMRNAAAELGGVETAREDDEGVGWHDKDGNGSDWIDRAFNLERYPVEGISGTLGGLEIADDEPLVDDWQGARGFSDSGEQGYRFAG
ncbi:hypothetical protein JCM10212_000250 [Sporobolomyces blumeae]